MATEMEAEVLNIASDTDVARARQKARELGATLRLSPSESTLIATAVSEITRNIIQYAQQGEIEFRWIEKGGRTGVMIIARDHGPGIPDIALAMQDGYSTSKGLGLGLPGSKRLMDDFDIISVVGEGTTVTMIKWGR